MLSPESWKTGRCTNYGATGAWELRENDFEYSGKLRHDIFLSFGQKKNGLEVVLSFLMAKNLNWTNCKIKFYFKTGIIHYFQMCVWTETRQSEVLRYGQPRPGQHGHVETEQAQEVNFIAIKTIRRSPSVDNKNNFSIILLYLFESYCTFDKHFKSSFSILF